MDLGIVLAIASIIITIVLGIIQYWDSIRNLNFRTDFINLSLVNGCVFRSKDLKNLKVEIYSEGEKIEGTAFDLQINLTNAGRNDIRGDRFVSPCKIQFPKSVSILKADLISYPSNDMPIIDLKENQIELKFGKLLKRKQSYKIGILASTDDSNISDLDSKELFDMVECSIYAQDIEEIQKKTSKKIGIKIVRIILFFGFLVTIFSQLTSEIRDYTVADCKFKSEYSRNYFNEIRYDFETRNVILIGDSTIMKCPLESFNRQNISVKIEHEDNIVGNYYIMKYRYLFLSIGFLIELVYSFIIEKKKKNRKKESRNDPKSSI